MSRRLRWPVFWALVAVFIFIVCFFAVPAFNELLRGLWFLSPFAVFCLLGIVLVVCTLREKVGGWLKRFFLLAGASSAGFFLAILLHNAFYALAEASANIPVLGALLEFLHVIFFFIAVPVCPLGFLVGAVGAIVVGAKNRRRRQP
jgi:hypothetical protein